MNAITRYTATERRLRRHLSAEGWHGETARIIELELVGIESPGWVQFFAFEVAVEPVEQAGSAEEDDPEDVERTRLLGVLRDDGREGCKARYAESIASRDSIVAEWSTTAARRPPRATPEQIARTSERIFLFLIAGFVLCLVLALFSALRHSVGGDAQEVEPTVELLRPARNLATIDRTRLAIR